MLRDHLGLILAAAGAFFIGLAIAPTRTVTKTEVVRVEKRQAEAKQEVVSRADVIKLEGAVITRWRTAPSKDCAPTEVERIETKRQETQTVAAAAKSEQREVEVREHVRTEVQLVERLRPGWAVAARGGLRLDGGKLAGLTVERRLVGGLWLQAWGDTSKAAGLGVRFEW